MEFHHDMEGESNAFFFVLHLLLDMMVHEGRREIGVELGWPLAPRESLACFTLRIDCVLSQYYCVCLGPSLVQQICV